MTNTQAARFAERLEAKLVNDSAEDVVFGLADLVLMKDDFKSPELYRQLLKLMAWTLWLKVDRP